MKLLYVLAFSFLALAGCSSLDKKSLELSPGMPKDKVQSVLGVPDARSFNGENEAWQYQGVVGFGQCTYITAWFKQSILHAVTSRRGSSVAGCGLGSREVDWGQMPSTSEGININIQNNVNSNPQ